MRLTSNSETDTDLVRRAVAGHEDSLAELLLLHSADLSRYVSAKFPPALLGVISADDIVQQTFVEAWRRIGHFDPDGDACFQTWLTLIARRRAKDAVRAHERLKRGGGDGQQTHRTNGNAFESVYDIIEMVSADSHTASKSAVRHEAVLAVQRAIHDLPDRYRQAAELRLLDGKSLEEAAAIMQCSPRVVQGLIDRAKKKLRDMLVSLSRYQ